MKRGQVSTGLVILGVVAIIAVIGLVLLFTRAGKEGAAVGSIYNAGPGSQEGIAQTFPVSPDPMTGIAYPDMQYPAAGMPLTQTSTVGERTPAFIIAAGYNSLEAMYACNEDLNVAAQIMNVEEAFNCYTVPVKGISEEAAGMYPRASSAYARPNMGTIGKTGGDVYCYATSTGAEQQKPKTEQMIRENILKSLVDRKDDQASTQWRAVMMNGVRVPVCPVAYEADYVFPQ